MVYSVVSDTIARAHKKAVEMVCYSGDVINTEDGIPTWELSEPLSIHVDEPLKEPIIHSAYPFRRKLLPLYIKEVTTVTQNTFDYTYGNRLLTEIDQIDRVVQMLTNKSVTRRAIAHTWRIEKDLGAKHPPCLQTAQFTIRHGYLNGIFSMRSNDVLMAWGANAVAFSHLLKMVADRIPDTKVGYLETIATCPHIYETDSDVLNKMLVSGDV